MRIKSIHSITFFTIFWLFCITGCGPEGGKTKNLRSSGASTANAIPSVIPDQSSPPAPLPPDEYVPDPEELVETETETNGWQGDTGTYESEYTNADGIATEYFISVPTDATLDKPYGLLVHIHDGGADEYKASHTKITQAAEAHNLIPLVVKAPSASDQWFVDGVKNSDVLNELLTSHIFTKHNIAKKSIFFVGKGSGSTFLTSHFIPANGDRYTGGAVLLCGGNINWTLSNSFPTTPAMPIYFHTSKEDYVYPQVEVAVDFYRKMGSNVTFNSPEGGQHCDFDLSETTDQILGQLLATN